MVIHFGQLGDVVLGLPALAAIRRRFPNARITVLSGKSTAEIVRISGVADEQISVDRVELRDGNRFHSIAKVISMTRDVRRRGFDLVIDLHSLYETNVLGFLSGARSRLYANRENRSLDFLARFPKKPPSENKSEHHTDRYLAVLEPLGIRNADRLADVRPSAESLARARSLIEGHNISNKTLIGLFLGAGHPTRKWNVENFVKLGRRLSANPENQVLVFLGPEERDLRAGLDEEFGESAIVIDEMPLPNFFAMLSLLKVLVSGDTGPMHLGAVAGASIVLISEIGAPTIFRPLTGSLAVLDDCSVKDLSVEKVETAVLGLLKQV